MKKLWKVFPWREGGYKIGVLYGTSMVHHLFSPFHSTFLFLEQRQLCRRSKKITRAASASIAVLYIMQLFFHGAVVLFFSSIGNLNRQKPGFSERKTTKKIVTDIRDKNAWIKKKREEKISQFCPIVLHLFFWSYPSKEMFFFLL